MAGPEPARKLEDQVYDKGDEQPVTRPNLQAIEGGSESSKPNKSWYKPDKQPASPEDLSKAEKTAQPQHDRQLGKGYLGDSKETERLAGMKPSVRGVVKFAKTNRGKVILGGAGAGFVTLTIIGFFALLPLKILHIVNNLESHFFATSENAVSKEADNLFSGYLKRAVLPGLNNCARQSTLSKECQAITVSGSSPVATLFRAWKTNKIETTLAEKYGTEFRYDSRSKRYFIKSPYLSKEVGFASYDTKTRSVFLDAPTLERAIEREVKPSEFARFASGFFGKKGPIEDITMFRRVMYRFKMKLILSKYGNWERYIIARNTRYEFKESVTLKKQAAKIKIAQRVVSPMSEQLSLIMQCVFSGGCDVTMSNGSPGVNGERRSKAEIQLADKITSIAAEEGGAQTLNAMSKATEAIRDKGWTRFAAGEVFAKIVAGAGGDETAQQTARNLGSKAVGPVGWVMLGSMLIDGLNNAGPVIKELGYTMNATAYANTYITYRTYADEIKSGNVDATEVGSFTDTLSGGAQCDDGGKLNSKGECSNGEPQLGGTATAEQAPLYNYLINGNSTSSGATSAFDNLLGGNVYAASNSSQYLCKDGKPVPAGQLVCSEEKLNKGNHALDSLHNFMSLPVMSQVSSLAGFLNGTVFKYVMMPLGWFFTAFGHIPGVSPIVNSVTSLASSLVGPLFKDLVNSLIDIPVSTNMSGGRTFDAMAGGADVVGNDFSHHQLGGVELTNKQVADIIDQQNQQSLQQYQHQSFFARMFDTDSNYSLISKLIMTMPTNKAAAQQSIASFFTNPLGRLASSFGSLFNIGHVFAAAAPQDDPFGITQYGYPADDPIFTTDPETYWNTHCTDNNMTNAWNNASLSSVNNSTLQPENPQQPISGLANGDPKGTDPCLLIQAAVGSAGAIFDSSLLTADDLAGSSSGSSSGGDVSGSGPIETGSNAQLAQKILDYQKTGQYHCDNSGDCTDLQKVIKGQSLAGSDGCKAQTLDPRVLKLILYVIEVGKFNIGTFALCGDHHDDGPNGHSGGFAVDFSSVDGVAVVAANAKPTTLKLAQFLNSISGELRPRQLITAGYGNKYDNDLLALEIPDSAFYGGKGGDNADHRNHIHTGY